MKKSNKVVLWWALCFVIDVVSAADYSPTDKIFLNCGGPPDSSDTDGRKWTSDIGSKFALSSTKSSTAPASVQKPSVPEVPYMTARIFQSEFTYSFPVGSGRKFLRLHFYPASYNGLNASDAVFSVTSGEFTLMRNFSAALTTEALNYDYLMKEFSVNVPDQVLNVTFTPSPNASNSYAFVNGIEVVSHPDIYTTEGTEPVVVVGQSTGFIIDNSTALENVYRLNVGGNDISSSGDTGLFRSWRDDSVYIFGAANGVTEVPDNTTIAYPSGKPTYIAPLDVYSTLRSMGPNASINQNYNLTWLFDIDSGFSYLIRLHFCEVTDAITKQNQRVFSIYLNNQTAEEQADVIAWAGGNGIPVYKDYVVFVPNGPPRQDLWLALHPYTPMKPQYYDAILNGVEIFKLSDKTGNLAGVNPLPLPQTPDELLDNQSSGGKDNKGIIGGAVGGGIGALLVLGLIVCVVVQRRRQKKDSSTSDGWLPLSLYGNSHSSGSAKTNTTGSYASSLPSNLCRHFSVAEIKSATNDFDEALLLGVGGFGKVYRGEIDSGTKVAIKRGNPLSEQGIHEFQTEIEMLSKLRHRHLVSLIGYCEENCEMILVYDYMDYGTLREHLYKTQKPPLPWKQRLEICIALNPALPKEQVSLAEWAQHCYKKGILDQITDPYLKGKIAPECFKKFTETAVKCVSDIGTDRPSMGDVLWNLEFALQLQESAEESGKGLGKIDVESYDVKDPDSSSGFDGNITDSKSSGLSMSIGGRSLASEDSDGLTPSAVFSQIMNPKGR
ncbi:hypothetical protein SASPL_111961 [Salvia splendens]|uniref:Protein kinase domain-containing protein n=1 Tax=Salvia splendens TaxID=180675 RepID=A0A8X8YCX8_SALSN|nr:hypothetical protein SASPL_111961 [Salvia splendens]